MNKMDSELKVCPYNPSHRVAAKKFVTHIVKCRKNNPNSNLQVCKFNYEHHIPAKDVADHEINCPDQ